MSDTKLTTLYKNVQINFLFSLPVIKALEIKIYWWNSLSE